jgi:hypothetical protein
MIKPTTGRPERPLNYLSGIYTSVIGDEGHLIPYLYVAVEDLARRQFEHAMGFQINAGYPKGSHSMPKPQDAQTPVERYYIDRKQHAKGMNDG